MAQASLREANRVRLRKSKLGFIRSAIGAPLRVDGTTIGAILLTSERQENAWTESDAPIIEALADEAARAIERARRHEEEMAKAQLDAVTGMAMRPHLLSVIDNPGARFCERSYSYIVERGGGGPYEASGATARTGEKPINASGGLKAKGHPVGATGVAQLCDIFAQIRCEAGDMQLHPLADEGLGFFDAVADYSQAWKVGSIGSPASVSSPLVDDDVFAHSFN